jgi:hypothetical protein
MSEVLSTRSPAAPVATSSRVAMTGASTRAPCKAARTPGRRAGSVANRARAATRPALGAPSSARNAEAGMLLVDIARA